MSCGTLIKLYDYRAPRSNVCGPLFDKIEDYLIQPALPLRIVECRAEYHANVMAVNVWDRPAAWASKLERDFQNAPSLSIPLSTGEVIHGEVRVFKLRKGKDDPTVPTGVRAIINGQSHAKLDARFFRSKHVGKEHIAASLLVTLDCTNLGMVSRNKLFMSNREHFREDALHQELLTKLQRELKTHEALVEWNERRYEEKLKSATTDESGLEVLEDLLSSDPALAELFGSFTGGRTGTRTATGAGHDKGTRRTKSKFKGNTFPSYIKSADGGSVVSFDVPQGGFAHPWFQTDVQNDYFSRRRWRGSWRVGDDRLVHSVRLYNGRLTFTCGVEKHAALGTTRVAEVVITDKKGSGPFKLTLRATVVAPVEKLKRSPGSPRPPPHRTNAAPSRPNIKEVDKEPEDLPITIERNPQTGHLELYLNRNSGLLVQAKRQRAASEASVVDYVFKYGLAFSVMAMLEGVKGSPEWVEDEASCRARIAQHAKGLARVMVPLCLSLPGKLKVRPEAA